MAKLLPFLSLLNFDEKSEQAELNQNRTGGINKIRTGGINKIRTGGIK